MIKTNVIEAIYHSNYRSELRLDSKRVYQGNLRIGNLGCVINPTPDRYLMYSPLSGVLSLIQNIYLYDGNVLLDQILEAHHLFAFRHAQRSNAANFNKNQYLTGVTNSYAIIQDPNGVSVQLPKVDAQPLAYYNYASSGNDGLSGWLNLTAHSNFLRNMIYNVEGQQSQFIDTNVFRNLRVVIEWRPQEQIVSCFQGKTGTKPVTAQINSPVLFCDEVIGLTLPQSLSFAYDAYEVDKLVCNSASAQGVATTKARLNGFNNKLLKRLLLMNIEPTKLTSDTNGDGVKCDGSQVYANEVLQIYVNGSTLFDFNGIDSDARRLSMCADAWGPQLTLPLGSYANMTQDLTPLLTQRLLDMGGRLSYSGCSVNERIADLTIEHSRFAGGAVPSFLMYLWGEVAKGIQINNGQYNVAYL